MLNDWSDRLPTREAAKLLKKQGAQAVAQRMNQVEQSMAVDAEHGQLAGSIEALRHFLTLRDKLFPSFPADPVLKILMTVAVTPEGSDKASVTGIAYGAGVPATSALRHLAAMEVEGIIERKPHPFDARSSIIHLTNEGRRRIDALAEQWHRRLIWLSLAPLAWVLHLLGAPPV